MTGWMIRSLNFGSKMKAMNFQTIGLKTIRCLNFARNCWKIHLMIRCSTSLNFRMNCCNSNCSGTMSLKNSIRCCWTMNSIRWNCCLTNLTSLNFPKNCSTSLTSLTIANFPKNCSMSWMSLTSLNFPSWSWMSLTSLKIRWSSMSSTSLMIRLSSTRMKLCNR